MSLVYDALRRLDQDQAGPIAACSPATPLGPGWPRPNIVAVVLLGLLCAPAVFLLARGAAPVARPVTTATSAAAAGMGEPKAPTHVPAGTAADAIEPVAAPSVPLEVAGSRSEASRPLAPSAPASPASPASTPTSARPDVASGAAGALTAQATSPEARDDALASNIHIKVESRDAATGRGKARDLSPEAEAAGIGQAIAELEAAQAHHDHDAAGAGLARLSRLLPADSLTLLRMRAWLAHDQGDLAEAERLYGLVVGRVPNDRNASINLALLQAGHGKVDQARARLDRFTLTNGDSPELAQAKSQLGDHRR